MKNPEIYHCSSSLIPGTSYREVYAKALQVFQERKKRTKRIPYIKSLFFKKEKIFLSLFWEHLRQKNIRDRTRRLKYMKCAFELVESSHFSPIITKNPNRSSETFYRFWGESKEGNSFIVQIKEVKSQGKYLVSFFPH